MRPNVLHICVLLATAFSVNLFAKDDIVHRRKMDISINIGEIIVGGLPVRFSFGVTERIAIGISAWAKFFSYRSETTLGGGASIDAKFYLTGRTYQTGFYAKPGIKAGYQTISHLGGASIGGFATIGHGWVWPSGFTLDLGLGIEFVNVFAKGAIAPFGFVPSIDISLGYAF